MTDPSPAVRVRDLRIQFDTDDGVVRAVEGIDLDVGRGEIVAIVGESGSGKTVTARSLLGLLPSNAHVSGSVEVDGTQVVGLDAAGLRRLRGSAIAYVFQDPTAALNPVRTVGWQIAAGLRAQARLSRTELRDRTVAALAEVGIPDPARRAGQYPHQFSGGQRQRIVIAAALALGARVLVADEPTTALDVTIQAEILDLLRHLRDERETSIVLVTHNMGVVADIADRAVVMKDGLVVEVSDVHALFAAPRELYTRALIAAARLETPPAVSTPTVRGISEATDDAPVVVARGIVVEFPGRLLRPTTTAVRGVDLTIGPGEVYGLVGESGSGKTTLGRVVAGLQPVVAGELSVLGHDVLTGRPKALRELRRSIGFVFQSPSGSFDPQRSIGHAVGEPLAIHTRLAKQERRQRVAELLAAVHLQPRHAVSFPHELSGGQLQRAGIARALALRPALVIADEPTSALDVSVQARILDLFRELQAELGFAALFISHDLAVVEAVADRVGVLRGGAFVEEGSVADVLRAPTHEYTRALVAASPVPDPTEQRRRTAERYTPA